MSRGYVFFIYFIFLSQKVVFVQYLLTRKKKKVFWIFFGGFSNEKSQKVIKLRSVNPLLSNLAMAQTEEEREREGEREGERDK